MRTTSRALVLGFLSLLAPALDALGDEPAPRPNILYIMSDDHASHAISAYGSKINKTPNIDRIAAAGVRLDNCFVTNSICTPSRAAILTGQYAHINGVPVFNHIDPDRATLPKYLQAAGYHTGMIGKWHLGTDPTGFDTWRILPGQGRYNDPVFLDPEGRKTYEGYVTDVITDFALEFLEDRPADKPFFLMCHHKAPHREWTPREDKRAKWETIEVPEPDTLRDDYESRSDAAREATMRVGRDMTPTDLKLTPPEGLTPDERLSWNYQRYMRDYLACVESVDDNVGRLLDYLEESGLAENTLVIYTSDQGFYLGDHGWFDKRFMYEESLRMPFLARFPGVVPAGTSSDAFVLNIDFAPTMLAAAGVEVPADMQGRDALPVLRGETPDDWRTSMYYRYYHYPFHHQVQPHYGVRTDRYKLIYFNKNDQWELYDLEADPDELHNVADDPEYAEIRKELEAEMRRLQKKYRDEGQFEDHIPRDDV